MLLHMVLLQAMYGVTFTISKILVGLASPLFIIGIRMPLAGILLLGYYLLYQKGNFSFIKKHGGTIVAISLFNIFLPYALRYWAMQYLSSIKTALLFNLSPFISYLLAYFLGQEKMSMKKWLGLGIGFTGFLPVLISHASQETSLIGFLSLPEIAMIIAVTSGTLSWILLKRLLTNSTISSIALNGTMMIIGGFFSLFTSFFIEPSWAIREPISFFGWLSIIILITNVIYYNGYAILLKRYSATLMMLASLTAPISAGISSAILLQEKINMVSIISGVIIFIGFYIFYQQEKKSALLH